MLVPQAMAYAMLAGLPPIIGLYASLVPLAVYAIFGSSRELAVGPVAMVGLLVAAGLTPLAPAGSATYVGLALTLSLMVGVLHLIMAAGRLGFLLNFLSHPVVSGFTSAAAIIIALSQLKHLLGFEIPAGHEVHKTLWAAWKGLGSTHVPTLALGLGAMVLLVLLQKIAPRFPRALAVVATSTLVVYLFRLQDAGVKIVGTIPAGLPHAAVPAVDWATLKALLPTALAISLVGFMESISVAKAFATRARYEVEPNRELFALGMSNLGAAFFGGFPVTGGFSRTAVNAQAGARTPAAGLVTAGLIAATLLFLTPLFYFLPRAVLAAIIVTAVYQLIDLKELKHLWKVKRGELVYLGVAFGATLTLGIEEGIAVGVGASLLAFLVHTTRPHYAVLGRLPGTEIYRNVSRHPAAETDPAVLTVRFDGQFYFGNVTFLKDTLRRLTAIAAEPVRAIVLDASSVSQLDSSADAALHQLVDEYAERGVRFLFANVKGPVMDVMVRSGWVGKLGPEAFKSTVAEAVLAARSSLSTTDASDSTQPEPMARSESPACRGTVVGQNV
jgi:SulP family sulfate permease